MQELIKTLESEFDDNFGTHSEKGIWISRIEAKQFLRTQAVKVLESQKESLTGVKLCLEKIKLLEYQREADAVREQKVYNASIQSFAVTALKYLDDLTNDISNIKNI